MRAIKIITVSLLSMFYTTTLMAQTAAIRTVENVTVKNLQGKPAQIPYWGEKNLMLFYIDPDRAGQNQDFTDELERLKRAKGDNLVGMGIINLKDAPFIPNALARRIAHKRTEKNKAVVLSDDDRILAEAWGLGDCNNLFVSIFINRAGEILFVRSGEFSEQDKEEFLEMVDLLK